MTQATSHTANGYYRIPQGGQARNARPGHVPGDPLLYGPNERPRTQVRLSDTAWRSLQDTTRELGYEGHSSRTGLAAVVRAWFAPSIIGDATNADTIEEAFEDTRPESLRQFDGPRLKNGRYPLWLPDRYTTTEKRRLRLVGALPEEVMHRVGLHFGILSGHRPDPTERKQVVSAVLEAIGLGLLTPKTVPPPIEVNRRKSRKGAFELIF